MAFNTVKLFQFFRNTVSNNISGRLFHALPSSVGVQQPAAITNAWGLNQVRTNVKDNWPRPSERKRVRKHGWKTHLSTWHGRRTIMKRILKGRHILTH